MAEVDPRVLTWVNRERSFLPITDGPLDELPKGRVRSAAGCPIACALGAYAVSRSAYHYELDSGATLSASLPEYVTEFIEQFDTGEHPELEL